MCVCVWVCVRLCLPLSYNLKRVAFPRFVRLFYLLLPPCKYRAEWESNSVPRI